MVRSVLHARLGACVRRQCRADMFGSTPRGWCKDLGERGTTMGGLVVDAAGVTFTQVESVECD